MNLTGQEIYQKGHKPAKVPAMRDASRQKQCRLAIPGVCCNDPARVVGAHIRLFNVAGAAQKPDDVFLIDGCDCCHAILDSRDKWADAGIGFEDVLRAFMLTLRDRRSAGLVTLKGETT